MTPIPPVEDARAEMIALTARLGAVVQAAETHVGDYRITPGPEFVADLKAATAFIGLICLDEAAFQRVYAAIRAETMAEAQP